MLRLVRPRRSDRDECRDDSSSASVAPRAGERPVQASGRRSGAGSCPSPAGAIPATKRLGLLDEQQADSRQPLRPGTDTRSVMCSWLRGSSSPKALRRVPRGRQSDRRGVHVSVFGTDRCAALVGRRLRTGESAVTRFSDALPLAGVGSRVESWRRHRTCRPRRAAVAFDSCSGDIRRAPESALCGPRRSGPPMGAARRPPCPGAAPRRFPWEGGETPRDGVSRLMEVVSELSNRRAQSPTSFCFFICSASASTSLRRNR